MGWRTPITLVVLLGVLIGAAFYGWQTIISPATEEEDPPAAARTPRCADVERFKKGEKVRAGDIVVNVFNAGAISGLATDTLAVLTNRGFRLGVADNAPPGASATNVTIMTDNRRSPQVRLVASQFKGVVRYAESRQLAAGITIVVGDGFAGINQRAKRSLVLKRPVRVCVKAGSAAS